ncbi:hypothetical protein ACH50O_16865 [Methylomonas sp. 2BW1-5-20]|uniref:hypothetical protein n=1 Tax=Methylomonas sp. 2BW1-5-20 TaxID=3376686 RepID=UPI0040525C14
MQLRFPISEVQQWANKYSYPRLETELMGIAPAIQEAGFLTKNQLQDVCTWKSPRSAGHVANNDEEFVKEVTGFALKTPNMRAAIETLTIIDGVRWPTASVILHLFHRENYPILDFRALWSVKEEVPKQYDFDFWRKFFEYSRQLANEANVTMRVLDRALWQYSKSNQPSN